MTNSKNIVNYLFLFFSFLALSISYPANLSGQSGINLLITRLTVSANESLLAAIILVMVVIFQKKMSETMYQMKFWPFWIFGLVTSVLYVLTLSLAQNNVGNLSGKINLLVTIIAIIGFCYLLTNLALYVVQLLRLIKLGTWSVNYWYVVMILLIIWTFQIFPLFPGVVTWDGYRQFQEFFHTHVSSLNFTYYPTGHHPWSATLVLGFLFSLGRSLGGPNFGLFTIVLVQIITGSLIYARVVCFVSQYLGKIGGALSLIFYASPFIAFWQVTVEKTPLFLIFTTWFTLIYTYLLIDRKNSFSPNSYYFELVVAGIGMMMFRNDGIYIVIVSTISLLIIKFIQKKENLKKLSISLLILVTIYLGWYKIALPVMSVVPGSTGEAISMPMRQLSEVVLHDSSSLSKKDYQIINKITPVDKIASQLDVSQGDGIKSLYPVDTFLRSADEIKMVQSGQLQKRANKNIKKETNAYLKLWAAQFLRHPKIYLGTFFSGNSKFLNPFIDDVVGSRGLLYENESYMKTAIFMQTSWYHKVHYWTSDKIRKYITWPNMIFGLPIIRTILQPAFTVWTILFALAYFMFKRSVDWIICIPLGMVGLVALLSPINGYERYMLPAIVLLPMLLTVMIMNSKKTIKNEGKAC